MRKQSFFGKILQGAAKGAMYILFRPKIIWKDKSLKKQAKKEPFVFICNHTCYFDGIFVGGVLGRFNTYTLVAKDWYDKQKLSGALIRSCRTVPVSRTNPDADWYMAATELMKTNRSIVVFPEGHTSRNGVMDVFKPGAALLASTTGAKLVPCATVGGYHKLFGKRQKIAVGEAIEMKCPENMRHSLYAKQEIAKAQITVQQLYNELSGAISNAENKSEAPTRDEITVG